MAEINVQRKRSGGWLWFLLILVLIALAIILFSWRRTPAQESTMLFINQSASVMAYPVITLPSVNSLEQPEGEFQ
jgi:hypothetical protein